MQFWPLLFPFHAFVSFNWECGSCMVFVLVENLWAGSNRNGRRRSRMSIELKIFQTTPVLEGQFESNNCRLCSQNISMTGKNYWQKEWSTPGELFPTNFQLLLTLFWFAFSCFLCQSAWQIPPITGMDFCHQWVQSFLAVSPVIFYTELSCKNKPVFGVWL